MGKNDHARLPSVNKTMFDKGNWQAFTAVVKYIDLFDKANCPAFIAVQKPRCRSNKLSRTRPMALNSDDPRAYGAQHSRSTRRMMFQDRCRRVMRNKAHFHGTLSSTTFPAAARQKPLTRCTSNGRLHLAFWRIRARRQSLIPGFEMGTQMFKVFNCSAQTCHLPALTASVRTTSRNASWSRKLSSSIVSNNLKNDYESEEINSQDSEHEDKKSNNQYSECDDKEETYAYYNETL